MGFPMRVILEAAEIHIFNKGAIVEHCRQATASMKQQERPPQSAATDDVSGRFTGDDARLLSKAKVRYPHIDRWQEQEMWKARQRGCSMEEIIDAIRNGKISAGKYHEAEAMSLT